MDCNYTPKKRNKLSVDHAMTLNGPDDLGGVNHPFFVAARQPATPAHTFYGQNIASSSKNVECQKSPSPVASDGAVTDSEAQRPQTGRFTAVIARPANQTKPLTSTVVSRAGSLPFVPHSFASERAVILNSSVVEPWNNPAFLPLPAFITHRLRLINSVEIPSREAFTAALRTFLNSLITELKETTCLSPDTYSRTAKYLQKGDVRDLSEGIRTWITLHRLCSGSTRYYVILVPRDAAYGMSEAEFEKKRRMYCQKIDHPSSKASEGDDEDEILFDRLLLQPQVYDILSFAHRSHAPLPEMLGEIKKLGFVSHLRYLSFVNLMFTL